MLSLNRPLNKAKVQKNDEFYTQLSDIEKELKHYKAHFKNKVVLCNCDDPRISNFFHYFSYNFEALGLKKLIATCYKNQNADLFSRNDSEKAIYLEYIGDKNDNNIPDTDEIGIKYLKGDGDFRSQECIELLKQSDIVCTNPPFSLFREYVAQLIEHKKKFLIIGDQNAITYKKIFLLIKKNKIWLGVDNGGTKWFQVPLHYKIKTQARIKVENGVKFFSKGSIMWFTNLDHKKRHQNLILYRKYNPKDYPKYDNYDVIEVSKVADIPVGYNGIMGVPITFLDKYNPEQFEVLGLDDHRIQYPKLAGCNSINGKQIYRRIIIRNKESLNENRTQRNYRRGINKRV
ncbi:MAG: adenine-specific methyltransferase EcoRI family protein [Endomicrobium sp.]|nr:adenine-specific methyltransferase EcoRI family protein [Endomicrobium sp.]